MKLPSLSAAFGYIVVFAQLSGARAEPPAPSDGLTPEEIFHDATHDPDDYCFDPDVICHDPDRLCNDPDTLCTDSNDVCHTLDEVCHNPDDDPSHDASHDASHDPDHDASHDPAHDHGHNPAHDASHDPAHDHGDFAPEFALILDTSLSWMSAAAPDPRGSHDPTHTGFELNALELSAGASVGPYFHLDTYLVATPGELDLEEAYATTLALPAGLQVRAGQFLTRFGRHNARHAHQGFFVDRPVVLGKFFGGEGSRGIGAELSWRAPTPWALEVVASATEATSSDTARSFIADDPPPRFRLANLITTLALKQTWQLAPNLPFQLGFSAAIGPSAARSSGRSEVFGLDLDLRWHPDAASLPARLALSLEVLARHRDLATTQAWDFGGFGELTWSPHPTWSLGARFEAASGLSDDPLDSTWTGTRLRTAFALAFRPFAHTRLRLQAGYDHHPDPIARGATLTLGLEVGIASHHAHTHD